MAVIFMLLYSFVKYLLHVILRRVETKRTVAKAKAIQSSETTASRQPRDEQSFEAVKTATIKIFNHLIFIIKPLQHFLTINSVHQLFSPHCPRSEFEITSKT